MSNYYIMKGNFYEVFGNQGMQAMSYQKVGDQMPIVKKFSSDDTMHDSSLTPKRVQGHRFGTYQGEPIIAQRYSNMSPSGQVMPHVVVQDMMEGRPNPLMIEDRGNRSKRSMRRRGRGKGRGRSIRSRHKEPKVEVIAEADEMNMPQILKFIQMLKDRKELDHSKKKSKKHKRIELDIRDADLDDPVPEELEKPKKKKRKKQKTKAKKAKKSKSQKIKALTKRLKRMKEE